MVDISLITIDGPAGSGKGTISSRVAKTLGWHMLDSGALYRLVALSAVKEGVELDDVVALERLAINLDVSFEIGEEGDVAVMLDGKVVSHDMRTEDCGYAASKVAACGGVRAALLDRQRVFQVEPGLVADGRDMGTVVFPSAAVKIYLTASAEIRAKRRQLQLKQQDLDVTLPRLVRDIEERDARDMSREKSPLKPADDALIIDTDSLSIDEVVNKVLMQYKSVAI